jgi:hypothetical protein
MVLDELARQYRKTKRKVLKELKKPSTRKAIGKLAGKVAGDYANRAYDSSTPEEKERWERDRIMHHGDAGYIVREHGRRKKSPLTQGFGEGLMISDAKDKDNCLYSLVEKRKTSKRKVRRT